MRAYSRTPAIPEVGSRCPVSGPASGPAPPVSLWVRSWHGGGFARSPMSDLPRDLKLAVRTLLAQWAMTLAALAVLALGIGGSTALFSVVEAVLLRPLPYAQPGALVTLQPHRVDDPKATTKLLLDEVRQLQAGLRQTQGWAAWVPNLFDFGPIGAAEQVRGGIVSGEFFPLVGVTPLLGRAFGPLDVEPAVVLSEGLWRERFRADLGVIGQSVRIGGQLYAVTGVMPSRFALPRPDVRYWVNLDGYLRNLPQDDRSRKFRAWTLLGRLAPGASLESAGAELRATFAAIAQSRPEQSANTTARLVPLRDYVVGEVGGVLWLLAGAVGCVLLIAGANVASLQLARATGRGREMAIRLALGAARGRLVRQLLTESLLLALVGGALGSLLALWGTDLFLSLARESLPRAAEVHVDGRALLFCCALALGLGVAFGLWPALRASHARPDSVLKESAVRPGRQRALGALLVAEIALAVVLLSGAGLLTRTLVAVSSVPLGVQPQRVMSVQLSLATGALAPEAARAPFAERLRERLAALPGVTAAGYLTSLPPRVQEVVGIFELEGARAAKGQEPTANLIMLGGDALEVLGVPVLEGRGFSPSDDAKAPPVTLVNQALARRYFPGVSPVGRKVFVSGGDEAMTVVGVVGDVHFSGLEATPGPALYFPYLQQPLGWSFFIVRSDAPAPALAAALREELHAAAPEVAVGRVAALEELLDDALVPHRFRSALLLAFAAVALVLALVGTFGVTAYGVAQRTQEFGVRLAVGAQQRDVLRLVLARGLWRVALGVGLGLLGARALSRTVESLVFGVSPQDPLTFGAVLGLICLSSLAALLWPAWRASRVDPVVSLRAE